MAFQSDSLGFFSKTFKVFSRFGVAQRAKMWLKNSKPPHVLVMTELLDLNYPRL